ncbi:hypothetical protein JHK86_034935 [Glycine max]|nr:hypothetical protein JHK86_057288 [Glycine max]KAG4950672.1 hypothetical protein JHK86_043911 [Glycine max]KAG4987244.1 hypothetical protein JHK86_034935 [Glycine max]
MSMSWIHSHPGASALLRGGVFIDREERGEACLLVRVRGKGFRKLNPLLVVFEPELAGYREGCSQGASLTSEESDLAHRSEDLEERVDTGSTMAVTEGDLFCDKQMTPNKNLRAANPKKRALSESGSKASYSTDSDYSTLDASDASSAAQYVLLFGESVPYLARTLSD